MSDDARRLQRQLTLQWSGSCSTVRLCGSFNEWRELPPTRSDGSLHEWCLALYPGTYGYHLVIDGERVSSAQLSCDCSFVSTGQSLEIDDVRSDGKRSPLQLCLRHGDAPESRESGAEGSLSPTNPGMMVGARPGDMQPIVIVMVGLPARGKTYIAKRIERYLVWMGHTARLFNVGNYRRKLKGAQQSADFFDPSNTTGMQARQESAEAAMADMLQWLLSSKGHAAIFDATNSTKERRRWISERCSSAGLSIMFVESICDDTSIVDSNIRVSKVSMPDYAEMSPEKAISDFRARISKYERAYKSVNADGDEEELTYVKLFDAGRQLLASSVRGYLPWRLTFLLGNLNMRPRIIWLTRHGESMDNVRGLIGGNSRLSPRGIGYARRLGEFIKERVDASSVVVWSSTMQRTVMTAGYIQEALGRQEEGWVRWKALDEIDAGAFDGWTYEDISKQYPAEYEARVESKLTYRYPRGESYQDLIHRLEPVMMELERRRGDTVIVAHQAVLRVLYAYLCAKSPVDCPTLPIPLHTIMQLEPRAYGCVETKTQLE